MIPKEHIKKHTTNTRLVIERMPACLFPVFIPAHAVIRGLDKYRLGWRWCYATYQAHNLTILYPEEPHILLGNEMLAKECANQKWYETLIEQWQPTHTTYIALARKLYQQDFSTFSKKDLHTQFSIFINLLRNVWILPLTVTSIAYCSDNVWIKEIEKNHPKEKEQFLQLATPTTMSHIKQEEHDLLELAAKENRTEEDLTNHLHTYFWIGTNYDHFSPLSIEELTQRINDIENPQKQLNTLEADWKRTQKAQEQLKQTHPFSEREQIIAKLIRLGTWWQDERKRNNLMGNVIIGKFFKAIEHHYGLSESLLRMSTPDELLTFLDTGTINKKELEDRQHYATFFIDSQTCLFDTTKDIYEQLNTLDVPEKGLQEVKGLTASPGTATGTARVIINIKEASIFNKGDILIASMTRPEFTPFMKKAGAIVTDEGGITCHAAIISRELGIPCIIGTKIATQVFKEGEKVKVDADEGKAWKQ